MFLIQAKRVVIVIIGAILNAIALNFFLIGAHVYASGFTGISQILSTVFIEYLGMENISTGILLFILNIPVAIVGWLMVGKGFTIYSFLSVIVTSLFLEMLPILSLSNDIMLNAVFGGVIAGVGVGISLKWGGPLQVVPISLP